VRCRAGGAHALPSPAAHPARPAPPRRLQLETENSKLRYQATHLKRALKECDEKLASKS
jgi:hypothetical protein